MKRAWQIFRNGLGLQKFNSFSSALRQSWKMAKQAIGKKIETYRERIIRELNEKNHVGIGFATSGTPNYGTGSLAAYYAASGYKGD